MIERLAAVDNALSERQKLVSGAVVVALGVALIAVMSFGEIGTESTKIVLGLFGALFVIVGTLLVGTSEDREHAV